MTSNSNNSLKGPKYPSIKLNVDQFRDEAFELIEESIDEKRRESLNSNRMSSLNDNHSNRLSGASKGKTRIRHEIIETIKEEDENTGDTPHPRYQIVSTRLA